MYNKILALACLALCLVLSTKLDKAVSLYFIPRSSCAWVKLGTKSASCHFLIFSFGVKSFQICCCCVELYFFHAGVLLTKSLKLAALALVLKKLLVNKHIDMKKVKTYFFE